MNTWWTTLWKLNINDRFSSRCISAHLWIHIAVKINISQWAWISIRDAPHLLEVNSCCRISTKFEASFSTFDFYSFLIFLIVLWLGHLNQACLGSLAANILSFDNVKPLCISRHGIFTVIFSHSIGTNFSSNLRVFTWSASAASLNAPPIGFANVFISRWTWTRSTHSLNIH